MRLVLTGSFRTARKQNGLQAKAAEERPRKRRTREYGADPVGG